MMMIAIRIAIMITGHIQLYEQNEKKLQMKMMNGELTFCHRHGLVVEARLNASYVESRSMS